MGTETDNTPSPGEGQLVKRGELALKVLFWLFPLIFAAGVWYSSSSQAVSKVEDVKRAAETIESRLDSHEVLESHPVTRTRLDQVQKAVDRIEVEQKVMNVEQRRSSENLSAICQATGASCR